MSVLLIDNAFNLRINLGLIAQVTGITDCHCFTGYNDAMAFLDQNKKKIRVVFINPNLDDQTFDPFISWLRKIIKKFEIKVRILYKPYRSDADTSAFEDKLMFTGMPITRNEIELLKLVNTSKEKLPAGKKVVHPDRKRNKLEHPASVDIS